MPRVAKSFPPSRSLFGADPLSGERPSGESFPRTRRLTQSGQFDRVFKDARQRVSERGLVLLAVENDEGHARLGMVIGKKAVAKSVDRSRLKRCIREAFRHAVLPAVDIVVLARQSMTTVPREDWQHLAGRAFTRLASQP